MNQPSKADYNRVVAQYNLIKHLKEEMEADPLYQREPETQETVVNTRSYNTVSQPPVSVGEASVNIIGFLASVIVIAPLVIMIGAGFRWW